ncbi:calmodulin-binding receptor-like cytoplasmic kinase 3 isoform X3 [Magnolia sinica]|uniref:calmodulin-binding receptor-like cytoplasmic kinase 3 isoform X3 n=1 Tax=Magnolia sinica TaxID=86752 RepID=UPI002659C86E|nr:calmodulin-binding receptor-like cytoplasmic kinase 3 isoform X3 [Magnolia sinica]
MHPSCSPFMLSFVVDVPQRAGRKLLPELKTNDSLVQSTEEKHSNSVSLNPKNIAMAASGMFLLCCALVCPCFRARRKETAHTALTKEPNSMDSVSSVEVSSVSERVPPSPLRVPPSPSRFSSSPQLNRVGSIHLNMSQINKATRNFSPALKIGEGGFGTVYRAQLQDGQVVAIKRAKKEHFDSLRTEFSSEIELLAKIEHRNLVKLLGYVDKGTERVIITEYIPNGTLREHLDGQHGRILDFNQRLEIAIDVTHALTYLHLYAEKPIIHRDVKSSNILLTESFRAKVADFGFARLGPMEADQTHISTKVKGTAGYLDPEYLKTYQLTPKSDVYSFGILLVEILSGRRPVELKRSADERVTVRWAFKKYNEGNFGDVMDPSMQEVVDGEILSKMFGLAFQCAAPTRSDRPTMKEVGEQLWGIRIDYLRSVRRG